MSEATVVYGFLGTIATLITSVVVVMLNQRAEFRKVEQDAAIKAATLEKIHVLVNSRLQEALAKIASLEIVVADLRARLAEK
jgi:hypothetical protein